MKKLTAKQKWLRTIYWLRKNFPSVHYVSIRRKEIDDFGICYVKKGKLIIVIDKKLSIFRQCETLLHEWAHVLTWDGADRIGKEDIHHGPEWGISYAKLYKEFNNWNFGIEIEDELNET